MPRGVPRVQAFVPEDYIYFECPFCGAVNDSLGPDYGVRACEGCGRRVEVVSP